METAVLQGLTQPNYPIILAKWNITKLKTKAVAVKLKESVFTKLNYKKKAMHDKTNHVELKKISLFFLQ